MPLISTARYRPSVFKVTLPPCLINLRTHLLGIMPRLLCKCVLTWKEISALCFPLCCPLQALASLYLCLLLDWVIAPDCGQVAAEREAWKLSKELDIDVVVVNPGNIYMLWSQSC